MHFLQDVQAFLQDLQLLQTFLQPLQDLQDLQVLSQVLQDLHVLPLSFILSFVQLLQDLWVSLGHAATSATVIEATKRTASKIASPFTILPYVVLLINYTLQSVFNLIQF